MGEGEGVLVGVRVGGAVAREGARETKEGGGCMLLGWMTWRWPLLLRASSSGQVAFYLLCNGAPAACERPLDLDCRSSAWPNNVPVCGLFSHCATVLSLSLSLSLSLCLSRSLVTARTFPHVLVLRNSPLLRPSSVFEAEAQRKSALPCPLARFGARS